MFVRIYQIVWACTCGDAGQSKAVKMDNIVKVLGLLKRISKILVYWSLLNIAFDLFSVQLKLFFVIMISILDHV